MRPLLAVLLLALAMVQGVGLSVAIPAPCAQECEDDGPDGQCAPNCFDCVCCAHARGAIAGSPGVAVPIELRTARIVLSERTPPEARAEDILHVPKSRLA